MNDELMRKISDAMDSEDGIAGDPELIVLMARTPEASRYAKHVSRLQRWVAGWPVQEPTEAEFEALAQKIDANLGDKFSGDFTRAPDFEEDEEFARVSSAILQASDLESDPGAAVVGETSDALELTMSAITELADQVNEEASSVPLGRVPLKRGPHGAEPVLPKVPIPTSIQDLPTAKPKPLVGLPRVPAPRGAATMIGNPNGTPSARDDAPASKIDEERGSPDEARMAAAKAPPPTPVVGDAPKAEAPKAEAAKPEAEAPKAEAAKAEAAKPEAAKAEAAKPEAAKPEATKAEVAKAEAPRAEAPRAEAPKPPKPPEKPVAKDAKAPPKPPEAPKAAAKTEAKSKTAGRVSIPVPASTGPRLELIEGGRSKAAPPPAESRRGWLPAVLAAAAIGLGVIGVGTMMSSGGALRSDGAPAVATVAPSTGATEVAAAPMPTSPEAPGLEAEFADPVEAPAPPPPSTPPMAMAASIGAESTRGQASGVVGGGGAAPGFGTGAQASGAQASGAQGSGAQGSGAQGSGASRSRPMARGGASAGPTSGAGGAAADEGASEPRAVAVPRRAATQAESPRIEGRAEAPAETRTAAPAPTTTAHRPEAASAPVGETLDRATVQSVMASVEPAVRACAGERHGTAAVDVVVQGTGRVTSATVSGIFQGSTEGSCIARAVRGARFPGFTGEALRFRYPFGI